MILSILLIIPALILIAGYPPIWRRVAAAAPQACGLSDSLDSTVNSEDPDNPDNPGDPDSSDNPDNSGDPDSSDNPDISEDPDSSDYPDNPGILQSGRPASLPKLSIVAYAMRDEENLPEYLDLLLAQSYPELEIILVCDASAEATAMFSERFAEVTNLHITFIPPGSHNLSRRKLAQTIGIKAASGDIVLLTATSVIPTSSEWATSMMAPFLTEHGAGCVASTGYIRTPLDDMTGVGKWYRQFDHVLSSAQWMDGILTGHPFRCDGLNMAFRRELFFANKGYGSTISLMDGDDDIFLVEIARHGRVALQLDPESILLTRWGDHTNRISTDMKERYAFTRRFLPQRAFRRGSLYAWAQWLTWLTGIAAVAAGLLGLFLSLDRIELLPPLEPLRVVVGIIPRGIVESIAVIALGSLIPLTTAIVEIIAYRRLAAILGAVRLFWALIPFMLWRPIGNLIFNFNHRNTRKSHFTWQR